METTGSNVWESRTGSDGQRVWLLEGSEEHTRALFERVAREDLRSLAIFIGSIYKAAWAVLLTYIIFWY